MKGYGSSILIEDCAEIIGTNQDEEFEITTYQATFQESPNFIQLQNLEKLQVKNYMIQNNMKTYNFATSPGISKNNQHNERISIIEQKLNYLCCEHDSLMPVLQIYDSSSHIHRWENSLKLINRKLNECQSSLQQIMQKKDSEMNNKNSENKKKMNDLKLNIHEVQKGLNLLKEKHRGQENEDSKNYVKDEINYLIEQVQRYTQISLASFSNEAQINYKLQNSKEIDKEKLSKMMKNVLSDIGHQYHEFKEEIQVIRSTLPSMNLQSFHAFTFQRLGCDLVQINEGIQEIFGVLQETDDLSKEQEEKVDVLQERLRLVNWQIKGMKKKYLHELTRKYEEQQDKYNVNVLQKKLSTDIKELQSSFQIILNKIQYLENEIRKR